MLLRQRRRFEIPALEKRATLSQGRGVAPELSRGDQHPETQDVHAVQEYTRLSEDPYGEGSWLYFDLAVAAEVEAGLL